MVTHREAEQAGYLEKLLEADTWEISKSQQKRRERRLCIKGTADARAQRRATI